MSLLLRLEKWLEAQVERLFGSPDTVQPVEIARRLVRVMEDQRRIGVQGSYVPNAFSVRVSEDDLAALASFGNTLSRDLANHIRTAARRNQLVFTGPVTVNLELDPTLGRGGFHVEAIFEEGDASSNEDIDDVEEEVGAEGTRILSAASAALWQVEITKGPDAGTTFTVRLPATIGRQSNCDVRLNDPRVSRVHAQLTTAGTGVILEDAGSTNGTKVGGKTVTRVEVSPADIIEVGATRLKVHPAGGD